MSNPATEHKCPTCNGTGSISNSQRITIPIPETIRDTVINDIIPILQEEERRRPYAPTPKAEGEK